MAICGGDGIASVEFSDQDKQLYYSASIREKSDLDPDEVKEEAVKETVEVHSVESSDYAPFIAEGLTAKQHVQAVQSMKYLASEMMKEYISKDENIVDNGIPEPYITSNIKGTLDAQISNLEGQGNEEKAQIIQNVKDNFEQLWSQVRREYQDLGIELNQANFYPSSGTLRERQKWEDMARFAQSSKETASSNVKVTMSFIPKVEYVTDENGEIVEDDNGVPQTEQQENFLGMNSFYRMSTAWNLAANLLADEFPMTAENFLSKLREVGKHNSTALQIWKKISSQPKDIQRDFATALGKHYAKFNLVFGNKTKQGSYELRPIRSDRLSRSQALVDRWRTEFIQEGGVTYRDDNGVYRVDQELVKNAKETLESYSRELDRSSEEYRRQLQRILGAVGVDVNGEYLRAAQEGETNLRKGFDFEFGQLSTNGEFKSNSTIGRIFDALLESRKDEDGNEIEGDPRSDQVNPTQSASSAAALSNLARDASSFHDSIWAASFTNVANDQLFAINDHEPLSRNFVKLADFDAIRQLSKDPFREHSILVRKLMGLDRKRTLTDDSLPNSEEDLDPIQESGRHDDILERIDFGYVDGLSLEGQREGQTVDNLSPRDQLVQNVAFFQNQGRDERIFRGPTLSDKSRSYVVTMPSYQDLYDGGEWDVTISELDDNTVGLSIDEGQAETIKEILYDAALSEIARIKRTQDWLNAGNDPSDHKKGEAYVEAAKLFHLFPELNSYNIDSDVLENALWSNGTLNDPRNNIQAEQAVKEILIDSVRRDVNEMYANWKRTGVDEFVSENYVKEQTPFDSVSETAIMYTALDYYVNSRAFNTDAFRLLHFDPAEASKWEEGMSDAETVRKTLGNFQKRLGGSMSPGMNSNARPDDTFEKATFLDREVPSEFKEQHKEVFKNTIGMDKANSYGNIESTDAQEYVTLEEYLRVGNNQGKISDEMYNRLTRRLRASKKRRGQEFRMTQQELDQILFQPRKPRYFGRSWDSDLEQMFTVYTKSSAFPLIPQFTKGTQLDHLRRAMEGEMDGVDGVDRVAYLSADKLGAVNPGDPFDSDGNIDPNQVGQALDQSRQTLRREGFGLQFLVPNKENTVPMAVQFNKLMLADMVGVEGIDAEQIWQDKSDARIEMFNTKREALAEDLGAEQMDDGSYKIDAQELKNVILREARARDWNPNFIHEIENLSGDEIRNSLSFTGASGQIESLLMSLVNDVVDMDMHGVPYVQQSSAGLQWENPSEVEHVAFASDFDPTTGLDSMHTEDGEVQPAQIVAAWHFKDEKGNPIPMSEYTIEDENGVRRLDMDRIDDELLNGVGFRIPFQGPNSMVPVRIVGFLPPSYGVQAFIPDDIIVQMGSDFDVDKLRTYLRQYRNDEGELRGIDNSDPNDPASDLDKAKSKYLDAVEDIVYNSSDNVQSQIRKPLDQQDLHDEIDRLQEATELRERKQFTHPDRQRRDYISQRSGADLIGITSLWSQLEAVLQHHEVTYDPSDSRTRVELSVEVRAPGSGSREVELNVAGGPAEASSLSSGRMSVQDAIRLFQNAAIDNANENVLGPLGINTINADAAMMMLMLNDGERGPDLEHVTRLMNQPMVKRAIREARNVQSMFSDGSPFNALSKGIESVFGDMVESNIQIPNAQESSTLPDTDQLLNDIEEQPNNDAWLERQANYLRFLQQLQKMAGDMKTVRDAFMYGDRNGPGSDLIEAQDRMEAIDNIPDNLWDGVMEVGGQLRETTEHHSGLKFTPSTELGHSTKNSVILARDMFSRNFAYNSPDFQKAISKIEEVKGEDLHPTQKKRVFRDYKAMVVAGAYNQSETTQESLPDLRRRLLFGDGEQQDIASRILEARAKGWGRDRLVLEFLDPTPAGEQTYTVYDDNSNRVERPKPAKVNFRYMKMEDTDRLRILQSVAEMLSSPRDAERELMRDLMTYTMFSRGWQHSPSTMADLIPPKLMEEMGIKSIIADLDTETTEDLPWHSNTFFTQYFQHNPSDAHVVSDSAAEVLPGGQYRIRSQFDASEVLNIESIKDVHEENVREAQTDEEAIEKEERRKEGKLNNLFRVSETGNLEWKDFISKYDFQTNKFRLWQHLGEGEYQEISTLGDSTGISDVDLEYNPNVRINDSAIFPDQPSATRVKKSRKSTKNVRSKANKADRTGQEKTSGFDKYVRSDSDTMIDAIRNINKDANLPEHIRRVSEVIENISPGVVGNVDIERVSGDVKYEAGFARGETTVYVNDNISERDQSEYARILVHESIHGITNSQIEAYQQVKSGEVSRSSSRLSDAEFRALSELDSLHQVAKSQLQERVKGKDYSFSDLMEWAEQLSEKSEFSTQDVPTEAQDDILLAYSLVNMREFTAGLMIEPEFQEWASEIEVSGDESFAQKFAKIVRRIISGLAKNLDVDMSRETLLGRGIESIIMSTSFNQSADTGSTMNEAEVISETKFNNVFIQRTSYGRRVVNNNKNPLPEDKQETILQKFDKVSENKSDTVPDEQSESNGAPSPGRPDQGSAPGPSGPRGNKGAPGPGPQNMPDASDLDNIMPTGSNIDSQIDGDVGTGRRDMDQTVGEFLQELTPRQRKAFRRMRSQIRTRCD